MRSLALAWSWRRPTRPGADAAPQVCLPGEVDRQRVDGAPARGLHDDGPVVDEGCDSVRWMVPVTSGQKRPRLVGDRRRDAHLRLGCGDVWLAASTRRHQRIELRIAVHLPHMPRGTASRGSAGFQSAGGTLVSRGHTDFGALVVGAHGAAVQDNAARKMKSGSR